jgi:single-stranded-DNA-specific exonuclease
MDVATKGLPETSASPTISPAGNTSMAPRWRLRPNEPERSAALARAAGVHPLVAQLLLNRGISDAPGATAFLFGRLSDLHDPETLPGAAEAAERIVRAVRDGRKIVIYGDYDVDGVCGTSILWACLRLAGSSDVDYYIPHRIDEGYGVNAEALRKLATERGASLIVTVDCGISAVEEAQLARTLGLELIITDHHTLGPQLPDAAAIVHPCLKGAINPKGDLCGCGVAFKLAWQIAKSFGDGKKASPQMRDFLVGAVSLVALATVADVVPLGDENRVLVRSGLRRLREQPSVGMHALMEVAGLFQKRRLNTGHVGFNLAPRLNAAGRLERAQEAVRLLTTRDVEEAKTLAGQLDRWNEERQALEYEILEQARRLIEEAGGLADRGAIVVGQAGWHPGVIGIVASRLAEYYHRPAIVVALADGSSQGSARSIPGFDLYAAISACSEGLLAFGGHAAAAGLRLPQERFADFADRFDRFCRGALAPELLRKTILIDAEVRLCDLSYKLVEQVAALEPHGPGNPRPLLIASGVRIAAPPRVVGERGRHVQLRVEQGGTRLRAIGWNLAERVAKSLAPGTVCSIAFYPYINEWNERRQVQLELKDFQVCESKSGP